MPRTGRPRRRRRRRKNKAVAQPCATAPLEVGQHHTTLHGEHLGGDWSGGASHLAMLLLSAAGARILRRPARPGGFSTATDRGRSDAPIPLPGRGGAAPAVLAG